MYFANGRFALAVFAEYVDEAHVEELLGAENLAAQNHLFGLHRVQLARQETRRSHTGEQVEKNFGKTELGAPLRNDHIERQRTFEPTTKSIALHQRDGLDRKSNPVHMW